ncbi:hypothetical protein HUU62_15770 [Rhodoferax sp. 4810]|uniref:DUF5666 domain-containing protein n=1 Tax=Thiospirillum jenense TaxID=1653858 RepID=A0A839HAJ2_9GAMM|nr:hypothetical protein [Thiospirillum jenense]MBB1075861.1 hypothetical protein [Rhodoferax jenense]MBB1126115.1 hypothetical protein [Thiospirillum jenense]
MAWTGNFKRISRERSCQWLLVLLLFAQPARAADPLLARVVTVNGDAVTVTLLDPSPSNTAPLTVVLDAGDLTADLTPGKVVRLWPSDRVDQNGLMHGARLTPLERGGGQVDRTGVRARLMRGAGRGPPGRPRGP